MMMATCGLWFILPFQMIDWNSDHCWSTITDTTAFCTAVILMIRVARTSLTSACCCFVIKSFSSQLLAWLHNRRGGGAHWPSSPVLSLLLIEKTHNAPSGQWLTKWWISSSILACWSIVTPPFAPTSSVDIGICHSSDCILRSHNCWLVKLVLVCGIINV